MNVRLCRTVVLLLVVALLAPLTRADDALDAARKEYVLHFFSVDAHVNLARQQHDHGDRLQAFYTLETARREHFEQPDFTRSFRRIFLGDQFDNSPKAEAALREQLKAAPEDAELLNKLADIYISRQDWNKAVPLLQHAMKAKPDDFGPVAALAQVYALSKRTDASRELIMKWAKAHPGTVDAWRAQINLLLAEEKFAEARPSVEEGLQKFPDDATLHFDMGIVLERADDLAGTRREFDKAVQLGPKNAQIQGWVARFYLKREIDLQRALDLYLNAYFLDPEFYDSEYAEERIHKLAREVAESLLAKTESANFPQELRPAIEKVQGHAATEHWNTSSQQTLLEIMGSDDEINRATAMTALAEHRSATLEEQTYRMLEDPDLRKRGMSAYLAMKWNKARTIPLMKKWLEDPAELVRFDAASALLESGGTEGRKIIQEYVRSGKEPNHQIQEILVHALQKTK